MTTGTLLVILSAILLGLAGCLYLFGSTTHPEFPPALLSFGLVAGVLGLKIP